MRQSGCGPARGGLGAAVEFEDELRQAAVEGAPGQHHVRPRRAGLLETSRRDMGAEGDNPDSSIGIQAALGTQRPDDLQGDGRALQVYDRGPDLRVGEACPEHLDGADGAAGNPDLFCGALYPG